MAEVLGTDDEAMPRLLARAKVACWGLPPDRGLAGTDTDDVFPDRFNDLLGGVVLPLFFRSKGAPDEGTLVARPALADRAGIGLPLEDKPSRTALISGGIET